MKRFHAHINVEKKRAATMQGISFLDPKPRPPAILEMIAPENTFKNYISVTIA